MPDHVHDVGMLSDSSSTIFLAGHRGLVGAAILRRLEDEGFRQVLTRTRAELDLTDAHAVDSFFDSHRPDFVFLAAAKVGGIWANYNYPADFISSNLMIQSNVIHSAHRYKTRKLLLLGSSCIYPKFSPQPIKEEYLLSGPLEPTNEAYAIAKIAGIKMGQAYRRQYGLNCISAMPTNLYGPGDNFHLESSHVLPALMRKFYEAKTSGAAYVTVWGTGTPKREFLHVDDLADACLFLMRQYDSEEIINVGSGQEVEIRELAALIGEATGFEGKIHYDSTKPDGTPRKLLDVSRLNAMGWKARIGLREGIEQTYAWFLNNFPKTLNSAAS